MAKTLFLFLFSPQVDSYINAITFTYDEMKIEAVRLVYVKGTTTELTDSKASTLSNKIWNRIESLKNKAKIYEQINERLLDRQLIPIEYSDLKSRLSQITKRQGSLRNCIVDLTGATKVPNIDVFSVCLALGIKSIYTFELAKKPDYKDPSYNPDNFLYHALSKNDYSYTCLSNTEPVRASQASLLRKSSLLWYVGTFSLFVMITSLYLLLTFGTDNIAIQGLNIAAAVVGLISPVFALAEQRQKNG
jgi:hypothetical protein